MGATKRTTEHTCKISPILNNKPRTRCRRPAQSSLIPEVTSNHVQALFQGLVVLECQNISPVDTIHQPQLITSTRNFIERFRNHRASPHSEHTCPGCRGWGNPDSFLCLSFILSFSHSFFIFNHKNWLFFEVDLLTNFFIDKLFVVS